MADVTPPELSENRFLDGGEQMTPKNEPEGAHV